MKTLLAIDPGESAGYAYFKDGVLAECGIVDDNRPGGADELVIEHPQVYTRSKADPNNIVTLAITAGRLAERIGAPKETWLAPRKWKGQLPKTARLVDYVVYKRVCKALTDAEADVLVRDGALHKAGSFDVVDAVGLGLFHLGRFR